ncbi:hypothetical protein B0H34DRAFT_729747, partial [Crassisporium funariophilum]
YCVLITFTIPILFSCRTYAIPLCCPLLVFDYYIIILYHTEPTTCMNIPTTYLGFPRTSLPCLLFELIYFEILAARRAPHKLELTFVDI